MTHPDSKQENHKRSRKDLVATAPVHVSKSTVSSPKVSQITSFSMNKMLSSHLLIYYALNHPDLELPANMYQHVLNKERFPTPHNDESTPPATRGYLPDLAGSLASWQSISVTESIQDLHPLSKKKSAASHANLILSMTTDDDGDPLARVASAVSVASPRNVMVFETDEEDNDLDRIDTNELLDKAMSAFIMPRMLILESVTKRVPVVVICTTSLLKEAGEWVKDISGVSPGLHVNLVVCGVKEDPLDHGLLRSAEMVFVVNDGSPALTKTIGVLDDIEKKPKITIVNVITTNYFSNLLELMNLRPHQVWKTSSLRHPKISDKLRRFILNELVEDKIDIKGGGGKYNKEYCRFAKNHSMHEISRGTNYKTLEKKFKTELEGSNIDNVDPLQLLSNFFHVDVLFSIFKKMFSPQSASGIWLLCSFTAGIGIGVGIASGAVTVVGFYVYDHLFAHPDPLTAGGESLVPAVAVDAASFMSNTAASYMQDFMESSVYESLAYFADVVASSFISLNSLIVNSVQGGFDKLVAMLML